MRMTELLGYARVSTNEQDLALQLDARAATGREKRSIFSDVGSRDVRGLASARSLGRSPAINWASTDPG